MAIPTRLFTVFFHPGCPPALCTIAIFGPSLKNIGVIPDIAKKLQFHGSDDLIILVTIRYSKKYT